MASSKKIIVVIGATGKQGFSVARTFVPLPEWHVRCVSRNPSSPASLALKALGAEVVQADLSDVASLIRAFSNANAVFINTDFWGLYIAAKKTAATPENAEAASNIIAFEGEVSYGKNAARTAASVPSLERFVYSAISSPKDSDGNYPPSHHASKAVVVDYILKEEPELAKKTSFIYPGGYNTNPLLSPRVDPSSGKYAFVLPISKSARMPIIDPKVSTGPFVRGLIEDEEAGAKLLAYDSYLSFEEVAELWSKASGQEASYLEVSATFLHEKFGIPHIVLDGATSLAEFGYMGGMKGYIEPFQMKKPVQTQSFESWLNGRDWKEVLGAKDFARPAFRSME
ncbi:NmrA-like family domain-containing protein [Lachnellula suecica]|uniref:NmrA-like family domain-containing protein n=1 Tax=Lachnellula suecica TaxID=602035 RepID=A0A8T9CCI7_9HELO|nr:NmrA-like family domain-containing protein [Lachnellula suecica]